MRVVSLDKTCSVPFEYAIFMVEDNNIVAVLVDSPFHRLMATYSTHELAMAVFAELHVRYVEERKYYHFPEEDLICADLLR